MQTATNVSDQTNASGPEINRAARPGISSNFTLAKDSADDADRRDIGKTLPDGVQILDPGYDAREDLSDLRVLIVDDNRFHRSIVRNALIAQGVYTHWEAEDVIAAEKLMASESIDLIILDNNMPGEKGTQFTRRIRQDSVPGNRCAPIIMISAYGDEKVINSARNAGVHEYVLKPFNVTTLLKRLQTTFRTPRDFVIAPGYVGPDRRWKQKLAGAGQESGDRAEKSTSPIAPGLRKPEVLVFD